MGVFLLAALSTCAAEDIPFSGSDYCESYVGVEAIGTLPRKANEVSGMAVGHDNEGVLWVVNDGDDLRLLAIVADGEPDTLGETYLPAPGNDTDIEDLAWGPCGMEQCLYIADIGDNDDQRSSVYILRLEEPSPFVYESAQGIEWVSLTYSDGAKDSEAMVIGPSGDVFIFSKKRGSFVVYRSAFEGGGLLSPVDAVDLSTLGSEERVRGAALDFRDGRLLLRTDSFLIEYCLQSEGDLENLSGLDYHIVPSEIEPQGESVAIDGDAYWHTSEGEGEPIYRSLL